MALRVPRSRVFREAADVRAGESFESSLGRAVRRHGGDYADYVALIGEVREAARTKNIDLRAAAVALAGQP